MEIMHLNANKANDYVCSILEKISNVENLKIECKFIDGHPKYRLIDTVYYRGEPTIRITKLNIPSYIELLEYALKEKGFDISHIKILENENEASYKIFYHLLGRGYSRRRKK